MNMCRLRSFTHHFSLQIVISSNCPDTMYVFYLADSNFLHLLYKNSIFSVQWQLTFRLHISIFV